MNQKIPIDDESQKLWNALRQCGLRSTDCGVKNKNQSGDRMCCTVSRAHRDNTYSSVVLMWGGGLVWVELNYCPTCGRAL
jgi:hypothetical protein